MYELADLLRVKLHLMPDGTLRGAEKRKIQMGPWTLEANFMFISDEMSEQRVTGFARMSKDLWLYLLSEPETGTLLAWVINGSTARLSISNARESSTGSYAKTLQKLKASVVGSYEFVRVADIEGTATTGVWSAIV